MPCVVIFVHGVNSEGEWYPHAEKGLIAGLNDRLGRVDFKANQYSEDKRTLGELKNSPVIRFYWGYRAPEEQTSTGTFPYKIPLKHRERVPQRGAPSTYDYKPYSFKDKANNKPGKYYWGGGPFQNGTTALNPFWYDGFDPKLLGGAFDASSPLINPERDRPLNKSPKRSYYVNASLRLAKLIDAIYDKHPNDTVAVVSHSQGTMVAALAMLQVKHLPDALFLCNSPYCFEDKFLDGVAYGRKSPTQRSRIRTFFNILERFKSSQSDTARKTTERQFEGVGGWLDIKTPDYIAIPALKFSQVSGVLLYIYYSRDGGKTFNRFLYGGYGGRNDIVIVNGKTVYVAQTSEDQVSGVYNNPTYQPSGEQWPNCEMTIPLGHAKLFSDVTRDEVLLFAEQLGLRRAGAEHELDRFLIGLDDNVREVRERVEMIVAPTAGEDRLLTGIEVKPLREMGRKLSRA
jgi:hypothetical protein